MKNERKYFNPRIMARGALQEIADASATSHHAHHLITIAQIALDGEPTTADKYNVYKGKPKEEKIKKERK